ncbi:hypothetical protein DFO70_10261 [Cytobacillus firmus]|uniref:Uncharacterized protein n=2 Tax=Cytobacillus TaxID=2675230 RepID=A0A366K1U5_CYTFI|nr:MULTISPECIES: hypothetical protein [Cytobacillus]RBP95736.1 hypothetical protein DFO70_10261 [Cytobacillus firmus]TDX44649.1 hypothetical protein DFO72_10361 [Cytobacillus oceanisediminis]
MELIRKEDLDGFVRQNVQVAILDEEGNDKAPFVHKEIIKTGLCPDGTHLRIYFDHMNFFAVPLTSCVEASDSRWAALDQEAGLKYVIKKRA